MSVGVGVGVCKGKGKGRVSGGVSGLGWIGRS